jgi:hypothetical protein
MKKILILLATICLCSCDVTETNRTYLNNNTDVKYYRLDGNGRVYTIEIEGHIYIVTGSSSGGGIIHAEHCPCENK